MNDDDIHRMQVETGRRAAAFMRHFLRQDQEALLELATPHMRSDLDTWRLIISREEEQPHNCFDNTLVLADRRAVATAFFAEHPPSLEMSDSVLHGGPHFAESGVELDLAGRRGRYRGVV